MSSLPVLEASANQPNQLRDRTLTLLIITLKHYCLVYEKMCVFWNSLPPESRTVQARQLWYDKIAELRTLHKQVLDDLHALERRSDLRSQTPDAVLESELHKRTVAVQEIVQQHDTALQEAERDLEEFVRLEQNGFLIAPEGGPWESIQSEHGLESNGPSAGGESASVAAVNDIATRLAAVSTCDQDIPSKAPVPQATTEGSQPAPKSDHQASIKTPLVEIAMSTSSSSQPSSSTDDASKDTDGDGPVDLEPTTPVLSSSNIGDGDHPAAETPSTEGVTNTAPLVSKNSTRPIQPRKAGRTAQTAQRLPRSYFTAGFKKAVHFE